MLVITVELWPFGAKDRAKRLGEMRLWNKGATPGALVRGVCDYGFTVDEPEPIDGGGPIVAEGHVEGYERLQPVWELVRVALNKARKEWS